MSKVAGLALIIAGLGVGVFAIAPSDDSGEQREAAQSPTSGPVVSGTTIVAPHIGNPRIPQERFAIPKDRDALTRELQKELRRVGCYEGEISGTWSQSTRRAMKTFIERMNARLPIEEPDAVLYSLLKGQHQPVCGTACSRGEVQIADGRCIPSVLLAHVKSKAALASVATAAIEKPAVAIVSGSASTTPQSTDPSLEGRMGLAGPSAGPTVATTTHPSRDRAPRAITSAGQSRVGQGAQRWLTAIFGTRLSNN